MAAGTAAWSSARLGVTSRWQLEAPLAAARWWMACVTPGCHVGPWPVSGDGPLHPAGQDQVSIWLAGSQCMDSELETAQGLVAVGAAHS
jgi:hypothetical protein